jgi:hypothetical protein
LPGKAVVHTRVLLASGKLELASKDYQHGPHGYCGQVEQFYDSFYQIAVIRRLLAAGQLELASNAVNVVVPKDTIAR